MILPYEERESCCAANESGSRSALSGRYCEWSVSGTGTGADRWRLDKIVVHPDSFDWYLRFNDDPDKPLHCTLEGKRKQTTKIMVSGGNSPTMDYSDTGRHQVPPLNHRRINQAPVQTHRGLFPLFFAQIVEKTLAFWLFGGIIKLQSFETAGRPGRPLSIRGGVP